MRYAVVEGWHALVGVAERYAVAVLVGVGAWVVAEGCAEALVQVGAWVLVVGCAVA